MALLSRFGTPVEQHERAYEDCALDSSTAAVPQSRIVYPIRRHVVPIQVASHRHLIFGENQLEVVDVAQEAAWLLRVKRRGTIPVDQ